MEDSALRELTYKEKNRALYYRQVELLNTFLEHHAISQSQYDKSLSDLKAKMKVELLNDTGK